MARYVEYEQVEHLDAPTGRKSLFAKNILNREGTVIGYVQGKCIYDLDMKLWGVLPTGLNKRQASYVASASGASALGYVDVNGNLFDSYNRFVGTIQSRRKTVLFVPVIILLLAFVCLSAYYSPYILKSVGIGVFNPDYPSIDVIQESDKASWSQLERLDILNAKLGKQIIYPGATNKYYFVLSNAGKDNIKYNLDLSEVNPGMITMRYKIKMANTYVKGDENKWATIDDLHLTELDLRAESKTLFCLEWVWDINVSDYNDTKVGNTEVYSSDVAYILNLKVSATINTMG